MPRGKVRPDQSCGLVTVFRVPLTGEASHHSVLSMYTLCCQDSALAVCWHGKAVWDHLSFGNAAMDCGDSGCFLESHLLCLVCTWFSVRCPRMLTTRAQYTPSVRWEVNHTAYHEHQSDWKWALERMQGKKGCATGDKETLLSSWETLAFLWSMVKLLLGTRSPFL